MSMKLELQNCYAQWRAGQDNEEWVVYSPEGSEIGRLPACLDEREVMRVIHFARNHQMIGVQEGVDEGLRRGKEASRARREQDAAMIYQLSQANEDLASKLHMLIDEE